MTSLLIVGCGSIGTRHARNAKALGVESIILCDPNSERRGTLAKELGATAVASVEEALAANSQLTGAVIATPSVMHPTHARFCIERGVPVFVEKPLGASRDGLQELVKEAKKRNLVTMMGQSYRFHPGLIALKKLLEDGVVGKVEHALYDLSQYLPDWHPNEDYRKEYAARKSMGGGVLLTSMSHSVDTIEWLFGEIKQIAGWKLRVGELELEEGVEDTVYCQFYTEKNIAVNASSDFLTRHPSHAIKIIGSTGIIEVDFIAHKISVHSVGHDPVISTYTFDGNALYVEELKHFLSLIQSGTVKHELDIWHGAHIVELLTDPHIVGIGV